MDWFGSKGSNSQSDGRIPIEFALNMECTMSQRHSPSPGNATGPPLGTHPGEDKISRPEGTVSRGQSRFRIRPGVWPGHQRSHRVPP